MFSMAKSAGTEKYKRHVSTLSGQNTVFFNIELGF